MKYRSILLHLLPVLVLVRLLLATAGCDRPADRHASPAATAPAAQRPTIASLVPAATDLIVGIGARDHLVAISNYDVDRPETAGLPKVGDYQSIDWERLRTLRPDVLVIFHAPDRIPAGLKQKADELGLRLVNVRSETLEDQYRDTLMLGQVMEETAKAERAVADLRAELDAVRRRVGGRPAVRTLIVRDESAVGTVGPGTFLDDLLTVAGGANVMTTPGWPNIDRERLLALNPDVIVQLLSDVPPQVEQEARRTWDSLPQLNAVRSGRVHVINKWYTQQPGFHVPRLAEDFARALHAEALTPASRPAG